ncbi:Serine protease 2 [Pseudolycoriella hygida]|uniref:Serine protease 2 n=1 Tax=Pseudolycoriella hygida TaxID=35572 RepID=A0A9Q0N197_9DIPT|nr:Serine protease 2 [Pseudolycoriella hygida]
MQLLLICLIFTSSAFAEVHISSTIKVDLQPGPVDIDFDSVKSIWEAPHLRHAYERYSPPNAKRPLANPASRIIGGSPAAPGQFPFHVLFIGSDDFGSYWCGASFLSPNWLLNAAHCVVGLQRATVYSIDDLSIGYRWSSSVISAIYAGEYDPYTLFYDIALNKISNPAQFSDYINYIQLPRGNVNNTFTGYNAHVQGFGLMSDSGEVSDVLQYTTLPIISNAECAEVFEINSLIMCASTTSGQSTCSGDSGGGLFVGNVHSHVNREIIGIVSFGAYAGCTLGYPVGFTRVTGFIDWIDFIMANY